MNAYTAISLDLQTPGVPVIVPAKQNDRDTRGIVISLYNGGVAYTPTGTPVMRYGKPDGTGGYYTLLEDGTTAAITVSGNTVTVIFVEQMLTTVGAVGCEVNFYSGTGTSAQRLTSFTFTVQVQASVLSDATILSSDYYNALTEAAANAATSATAAAASASSAAASATSASNIIANAAVRYDTAQSLTTAQTAQARTNIAAAGTANLTGYGSNTNGSYWEFPDGTLICAKSVTFTSVACTTAWGTLYGSSSLSLGSWPVNFTGTPVFTGLNIYTSSGGNCLHQGSRDISSTYAGATFLAVPVSETISTVTICVMAIGKWKA